MGFLAAASSSTFCLLHSPPLYQFPFPSSSSCSSSSWARNARFKTQFRAPTASSLRQHDPICSKRTFLLMGIAVLPLLPFNTAQALEGSSATTKESEVKTSEDSPKAQLSGISYVDSQTSSTSVKVAEDMLGAREGDDDSTSSVFEVGSMRFDGFGSFHPTHSSFEIGECSVMGLDPARGVLGGSKAYSVREEVVYEADDAISVDDSWLDVTPPRTRPRGRPKRMKETKLGLKDSRRPRGRPRKSECLVSNAASRSPSPPTPSGPYFTRATKAWLLAKSVGLSFPGSDEEAIRGLTAVLKENLPYMR